MHVTPAIVHLSRKPIDGLLLVFYTEANVGETTEGGAYERRAQYHTTGTASIAKQDSGVDIAIHKIIDEEDNFDTAVGIIYDNRAMIGANRSLCNLKKIALISKKEKDNFGRYYFYRQGDTADMLINRLRGIRWAIKRLECLKDDSLMRAILSDPSISDVALANSAVFYVMRWDDFMQPLSKLLLEIEAPERFMTIQAMIQRELNDLFGGGKDGRF